MTEIMLFGKEESAENFSECGILVDTGTKRPAAVIATQGAAIIKSKKHLSFYSNSVLF